MPKYELSRDQAHKLIDVCSTARSGRGDQHRIIRAMTSKGLPIICEVSDGRARVHGEYPSQKINLRADRAEYWIKRMNAKAVGA